VLENDSQLPQSPRPREKKTFFSQAIKTFNLEGEVSPLTTTFEGSL
jgi:hypothetical protein